MSNSGKAGHGRGNNRRRSFKRRENDGDTWQKGDLSGWGAGRPANGKHPETGAAEQDANASGRTQNSENQNKNINPKKGVDRTPHFERPKWIPPKANPEPMPASNCPWCGKPIRDISSAIADKETGAPVHFDCVISRITFGERLEKGEMVTYIGGGRFGVVSYKNLTPVNKDTQERAEAPSESHRIDSQRFKDDRSPAPIGRDFAIKKIIEWEDKDNRAEWRSVICDHYSVT